MCLHKLTSNTIDMPQLTAMEGIGFKVMEKELEYRTRLERYSFLLQRFSCPFMFTIRNLRPLTWYEDKNDEWLESSDNEKPYQAGFHIWLSLKHAQDTMNGLHTLWKPPGYKATRKYCVVKVKFRKTVALGQEYGMFKTDGPDYKAVVVAREMMIIEEVIGTDPWWHKVITNIHLFIYKLRKTYEQDRIEPAGG